MVGGSTSAGGDTSANRGHKSVTRASCSILFTTAVFVASASRRGTLLAASRRPPDAESVMSGQWLLGAGAGGRRDTAAPPTPSPTRQQAGWHRPRRPHAPDGMGPLLHLHLTGDTTPRQQAVSSSASIQHPTTPPSALQVRRRPSFGAAGEAAQPGGPSLRHGGRHPDAMARFAFTLARRADRWVGGAPTRRPATTTVVSSSSAQRHDPAHPVATDSPAGVRTAPYTSSSERRIRLFLAPDGPAPVTSMSQRSGPALHHLHVLVPSGPAYASFTSWRSSSVPAAPSSSRKVGRRGPSSRARRRTATLDLGGRASARHILLAS
jgi:hypothetical protein